MTLKIPKLSQIFQLYKQHGHELRFVGGCVRDNLINVPTNDIDLASTMPAADALTALASAGFKAIPTGLDHGTITLIIDSAPYEITTLRKDVSTDGRRATVETTDNWEEDANRRDFTINALYQDFDGIIYDYHNGQDDLKSGIVRFIGNPQDRITEDYLRILRYFRFAQRYATHGLPADLTTIFEQESPNIQLLSKERITQEFLKILNHPQASTTLKDMQSCRVLDQIIQDYNLDSLMRLEQTCKSLDVHHDSLRNLAALAGTTKNLRLSNDQITYLKRLVKIESDITQDTLHHSIFNEGKTRTLDALLIKGDISSYNICTEIDYTPLPINGSDLISIGISPGPKMGLALSHAADLWCKKNFNCTKKEILDYLKTIN